MFAQSADSLEHVHSLVYNSLLPILHEGCKVWIKIDEFFRNHSLKIISNGKKKIDPSHWKITEVLKTDKYKTLEMC